MRIVLDDAKMDAAAARLNSVGAALSGVQGRISPSLSAGAPPAIKGQVDAAIADARNLVAGVAAHCPARARELRRRAILARLAAGDIRVADLRQLRAWDAERPFINARVGNGKVDDGGGLFDGLKAFADGVKDAGSDVVGAVGKHGPEVGHTTLDILGLVPGLGEPVDGVNALIYAAEGDEVNAGLSAAAMIPYLGWGATGGKIGGKIRHSLDAGGGGGGLSGAGKAVESASERTRRIRSAKAKLITHDRAHHILRGEQRPDGSWAGGHRHPGRPGKSPFPASWSDDKILESAADIVSERGRLPVRTQPDGRKVYEAVRDGVEIRVVADAHGRIVTAIPLNTTRNAP